MPSVVAVLRSCGLLVFIYLFFVKVILSPFCKGQVGTSLLGLEFIWLVVGCRMQMNESIDIDIDDISDDDNDDEAVLMTKIMAFLMERNCDIIQMITMLMTMTIPMAMTMITNVVISAPGQAAERRVLETASASGDWLQVVEDSGT